MCRMYKSAAICSMSGRVYVTTLHLLRCSLSHCSICRPASGQPLSYLDRTYPVFTVPRRCTLSGCSAQLVLFQPAGAAPGRRLVHARLAGPPAKSRRAMEGRALILPGCARNASESALAMPSTVPSCLDGSCFFGPEIETQVLDRHHVHTLFSWPCSYLGALHCTVEPLASYEPGILLAAPVSCSEASYALYTSQLCAARGPYISF